MTTPRINAAMTLLDIVAAYPDTVAVFRSLDAASGTCLLCSALFDTVGAVAVQYGLSLDDLLAELELAAE